MKPVMMSALAHCSIDMLCTNVWVCGRMVCVGIGMPVYNLHCVLSMYECVVVMAVLVHTMCISKYECVAVLSMLV